MAYLSIMVLFCLAGFAADVVELEPVKAPTFNCARLTGTGDGTAIQNCNKSPFCYWSSSCKDDPCLKEVNKVLINLEDTCPNVLDQQNCARINLTESKIPDLLDADCTPAETTNTGILCTVSDNQATKDFDYCAYAWIRDQACPASICQIVPTGGDTPYTQTGCIANNAQQCQSLSEKDCGLVPKCLWNGSQKCIQDPCFSGSENKNCANWQGADTDNPLAAGDCIDFKPFKTQSSDIVPYCVYKTNKNPNICYFAATGNNISTSPMDSGVTYPTYDFSGGTPTCSGKLPGCEGTDVCYTTLNQKGALAGLYCTDGEHGSANVLRIPSLLVFLVISVLAVFNI